MSQQFLIHLGYFISDPCLYLAMWSLCGRYVVPILLVRRQRGPPMHRYTKPSSVYQMHRYRFKVYFWGDFWKMKEVLCQWKLQWEWRDSHHHLMYQYSWISEHDPQMWRKVPTSFVQCQQCSGTITKILCSNSGVVYHLVLSLYPFFCVFTLREPLWIYRWMWSQLASPISMSNTECMIWAHRGIQLPKHGGV